MNDPEHFLKRWSRRKLEPEERDQGAASGLTSSKAAPTEKTAVPDEKAGMPEPARSTDKDESVFDLTKLPPIESIDAGTDITGFLKPGVPPDLTRAALRRAWSADPAIRDFVGLSENSWDFNAGNVPGFGSISPEEVARLFEHLEKFAGGEMTKTEPAAAAEPAESATPDKRDAESGPATQLATNETARTVQSEKDASSRATEEEQSSPPPQRRHGGALPT